MNESLTPKQIQRALKAVLVSGFLTAMGVSLMSFILPLASLDARVSGSWLGTGFAGFFLMRMLAGPLGGVWADKGGSRMALLVGAGVGAVAPIFYMIAPSVVALYLIQFLLGVVSGLVRPVGLAILGGNDRESMTKWFTAHALAFNGALFLGPVLSGLLYWNRVVEPVLVALALCMVLAHLVVFIGVPATIQSKRSVSDEGSFDPKAYRALMLAIMGRSLGIGLMAAFYPVLLTMTMGHDPLLVGVLFALPSLVVCISMLPLQRWLARYSELMVTCLGMGASAIGLIELSIASYVGDFVIAGIVLGCGTAISMPSSMKLASRMSANQGKVFGTTHVITGLGLMLGPIMGGLGVSLFGSVKVAFVAVAVIGLLLLFPLLLERDRLMGVKKYISNKVWVALFVLLFSPLVIGYIYFQMDVSAQSIKGQYSYTQVAMGTVVNLTLEADSKTSADQASHKAFAYMRNVQADLDYRNPQGSVGRINRGAGKYFVKPTNRAYEVIKRAKQFGEISGGVFDPTIGALTTSPLYYVLDETIAESKKSLVNYRHIQLGGKVTGVKLTQSGMALDLGGIAKGAIIDGTVQILRKLGIKAGIVEAGGDFYCFGNRDWTVGIRHPRVDKVYGTVTVREKGVCGSGDYEQFVQGEKEGASDLRHHIINPSDMEPADKSAGVTVIAESAEQADGLATAVFIMGPNAGAAFMADKFPAAAAMWFTPSMKVSATPNFPKE